MYEYIHIKIKTKTFCREEGEFGRKNWSAKKIKFFTNFNLKIYCLQKDIYLILKKTIFAQFVLQFLK